MQTMHRPFFGLTAADLMTAPVLTLPIDMPLRDAARQLAEAHVHGAPVVDFQGRCVGVFSSSDIARWSLARNAPSSPAPLTCQYQEKLRDLKGEVILCLQSAGNCPIQRPHRRADGTTVIACGEPHCVPVDWQVVHMETQPEEIVRSYMTCEPATTTSNETITALARQMADHAIHRIIIVDGERRPIGIVSDTDLIRALAERHSA